MRTKANIPSSKPSPTVLHQLREAKDEMEQSRGMVGATSFYLRPPSERGRQKRPYWSLDEHDRFDT